MPIISPVANATLGASKTEKKQIGICLTAGSGPMEFTTTSIANNLRNVATSLPPGSANFFSPTNVTMSHIRPMGPLMVAKLSPAPGSAAHVRQQTVILQPRPSPIGATNATSINNNRPASTMPIRVPAAVITQHAVPPSSSSSASPAAAGPISVRTRLVAPVQAQHMPVLNLSQNHSTTLASVNNVKQIVTSQKLINNNECGSSVNLVVAAGGSGTIGSNVHHLKAHNELKVSMAPAAMVQSIQNINKVNKLLPNHTAGTGATLVTAAAAPKMISINNAGGGGPRLEIINTSVTNKSATLMAANSQFPPYKTIIISSPNNSSGETLVMGSGLNFAANKISVAPSTQLMAAAAAAAAASRGTSITTTTGAAQSTHLTNKSTILTVTSTSSNLFTQATQPTINNNNNTPALVYPGTIGVSTASAVTFAPSSSSSLVLPAQSKVTLTTSLKQQQQQLSMIQINHARPSSPKPRILNRKRLLNDGCASMNGSMVTSQHSSVASSSSPSSSYPNTIIVSGSILEHKDPHDMPKKKLKKQSQEASNKSDSMPKENGFSHQAASMVKNENAADQALTIMRTRPSLLHHVHSQSSSRSCQHFVRHSDVKVVDSGAGGGYKKGKRIPVSELLNDVKKQTGWKNYLIAQQFSKSGDDEASTIKTILDQFLLVLEEQISPYSKSAAISTLYGNPESAEKLDVVDRMCMKINDLTRANIQRTKAIIDNYNNAKQSLLNITEDHKDKLALISKKITHKRGFIK